MTKGRAEQIKAVIQHSAEKPIAIIFTQVDPDAIGAAMGLRYIIQQVVPPARVGIYYCGAAGHPQTRSLFNRFGLESDFSKIEQLPADAYRSHSIMLVDSSTTNDGRLGAKEVFVPTLVIDHHLGNNLPTEDANSCFVIEPVGAASTLVTELIANLDSLEKANQTDDRIILALAMGIRTDTKDLTNYTPRDYDAYGQLAKFFDSSSIVPLINYTLPPSHVAAFRYALTHTEQSGERLVAFAGRLRPNEGDDVSTIADYLSRMQGVTIAIVAAIIGDRVRLSARSSDPTISLSDFLRERFGEKSGAKVMPDGRSEGGALLDLSLGPWDTDETHETVDALVIKCVRKWIFTDPR